ncbi:MAG: MBL fold metallo-hydrolase [Bacteroidales bacterium]|nr:MBL fold metallo-hydrolase [Bacteroidales bacterium]MDD2425214.1 MBL fold metallo-hydrolase [Bacteroidales bacterium]MDD3989923.1 MBL fold metallo-hydrolase [Bacteroidales bacterium]
MIQIRTFYFNDLRECTYVLWDDTNECVIVDPGCNTGSERERMVKFIEITGLVPVKLLNTHGHFDHVMGNAFVERKWKLKTHIHPLDKPQLMRAAAYSEMFGYNVEQPTSDTVDINEGDIIEFGKSKLKVIWTPGHTRGGVVFYAPEEKPPFIIAGDSLFAGSVGRTDLPGGDYDELMDSLHNKILKLEGDCKIYPGHGPQTTIKNELESNPYLK